VGHGIGTIEESVHGGSEEAKGTDLGDVLAVIELIPLVDSRDGRELGSPGGKRGVRTGVRTNKDSP
jgi:hypothetical protein